MQDSNQTTEGASPGEACEVRPVGLSSIAHLTLATQDISRTAEFFEQTMGWVPIHRPVNIGCPAAWLAISPGQELHLIQVAGFKASEFEAEFGRHIAVRYPLGKFDALKARLVRYGAELIEPKRETPFQRFFFREPNGYVIEVVDAGHAPETDAEL